MRTGTGTRRRTPSVALWIVMAVIVAVGGVALVAALAPAVSEWLGVGTRLAALLLGGYAAVRTTGRMRLAWSLLTLMMLMWSVGDVLWVVYADAEGSPPMLSLADALYLGALVPAALGLLLYPVLQRTSGSLRAVVIDALVLALAVTSLSHTFALREVFASSSTLTEGLMLAVYPITDGLMLSLAVVLLLRSAGRPRLDVLLIGLMFAVYAVADSGYAVMVVRDIDSQGTWVHQLYEVTFIPLAGAALVAALTPTHRRAVRLNLTGLVAPLLPDLTGLLALGLALAIAWQDPASRAVALVLLAALGLRQLTQTAAAQALRVRLEERLAQRGRELTELAEQHRQLDAAKSEFITSVSHELRTPLTAIRGSLELLHDGDAGQLPPRARSVVEVATRGSLRLGRLVDDIIDLERLENGGFGLSPTTTELHDLVQDTVASLAPLAAERGVRLLATSGSASARCDPDRIEQVLVNLVDNALKYAPQGSAVVVDLEQRGTHAVISVTDAGRGIPAGQVDAVFGRFHQLSPGEDQRQGGTGLGLAICKGIIEAHGGTIWAESEGAGATFRFTLPVAAPVEDRRAGGVTIGLRDH